MNDDELADLRRHLSAEVRADALEAEVRRLREERDSFAAQLDERGLECERSWDAASEAESEVRRLRDREAMYANLVDATRYAVEEVSRLREEADEADGDNVRLRDGIRAKAEWWDRFWPQTQAYEVTADFRTLLDDTEGNA